MNSPVLSLFLSSFFLVGRELPVVATLGPGSGVVVVVLFRERDRVDKLRAMGIVPALKVLVVFCGLKRVLLAGLLSMLS